MSDSAYWDARVKKIRSTVSLRSLVDHFNIPCQSTGDVTQLHCPFHGDDQHASARIYETNTMYCWVCSRMWDVISFVKDFKGVEFHTACSILEDMFNIEKTDKSIIYQRESFSDYLLDSGSKKEISFDKDFSRLSALLIKNKSMFSMSDYVKYFYFFDNLYANYKENKHSSDADLQNSINNLMQEISILC